MRSQVLLGGVLIVVGLLLLYLLRDLVVKLIIFIVEFLGIVIALAFIAIGLALIFWPVRTWRVSIRTAVQSSSS